MTVEHSATPKVIVVAEENIYRLLRDSGAGLDVQTQVATVSQMWDDLGAGRLDQTSSILVFSDSLMGAPGELEMTVATMAPHATVFVVAWQPEKVAALQQGVSDFTQGAVTGDNFYLLPPTSAGELLDTFKAIVQAVHEPVRGPVAWPQQWNIEPEPDTSEQTAATPVAQAPVEVPERHLAHMDPNDPLSRPKLPGQRTFTVTSNKGGAGKSTTALMLATQFAQSSLKAYEAGLVERPLKVVLVDMNTHDGQIGSLIAKYIPTSLNIRVAPTSDEETILSNLVHDNRLGIDALLAPVRPRTADDVGPDFYRHVIRMLQRTHDVVIMDTSVEYLDPLISTVCLPEADAVLFVTTLATTAVQGMARALREITGPVEDGGMGVPRSKIGVVVNQSVSEVGMTRDHVMQAALGVKIVGAIPLATKDVLTATNRQRMHLLLQHEVLGPAYHSLAKACMPKHPLPPVIEPGVRSPGQASQAGVPKGPQAGAQAPRRGLFRR